MNVNDIADWRILVENSDITVEDILEIISYSMVGLAHPSEASTDYNQGYRNAILSIKERIDRRVKWTVSRSENTSK